MNPMKNLTRRDAIKTFGAVALATPALLSMKGCTITKAQLEAWAGDVDAGVAEVLTALGQATIAAQIKSYLTQFDTAVANWNGSSFSAVVISVSQDLELALGDSGLPITITGPADVIINVLDTIIANLSTTAKAPATPAPAAVASARVAKPVGTIRPHVVKVFKTRAEAVSAFNSEALGAGLKPIK